MLYYALVYFVVALIAAVIGFGGVTGTGAADIARMLFIVFLVMAVVSFTVHLVRSR